jgi:hypothetical protein
MGIKTEVKRGDQWIKGEEMEFTPKKEEWNIYKLEDGTIIKLKTIVTKIIKLNIRHPVTNDPIFSINSQNIAEAIVSIATKKGKK